MLWWCKARPGVRAIDLVRAIENNDSSALLPDRSVLAFRREALRRWPGLASVIRPEAETGSGVASRFVELELPADWPNLPRLDTLADAHGLLTLPGDLNEPAGKGDRECVITEPLPAPGDRAIDGPWTQAHIVGLGVSPRWIARAWSLARLPAQATFGQTVGAFVLASALRDGAEVAGRTARDAVEEVAQLCASGPPTRPATIRIGFVIDDVAGAAKVVAAGGY